MNVDVNSFLAIVAVKSFEIRLLKKSFSSRVSTADIDGIYDTALRHGALGGKILGAGGGGFMLFFVRPGQRKRVENALRPLLHVPFNFDTTGSQIVYYKEEDV